MSESIMKLRPLVEALSPRERDELIAYMSTLEVESFDDMLDRRQREYETGIVSGVPYEEVFSDLRKKQ